MSWYDSCGSYWELISLTCYSCNIVPEKGCKVEIHNHILDAPGLLESLRVNRDFGSNSLKETREGLKIWVIPDEGILAGILLWAFKFSQGLWNPSVLHDPLCWALSQYVEVADIQQAYWVWPDSYLPASPPGPVKLPGASRNHMETLQILTTLFLIKLESDALEPPSWRGFKLDL